MTDTSDTASLLAQAQAAAQAALDDTAQVSSELGAATVQAVQAVGIFAQAASLAEAGAAQHASDAQTAGTASQLAEVSAAGSASNAAASANTAQEIAATLSDATGNAANIATLLANLSETASQIVGRPASATPVAGTAATGETFIFANPAAQASTLSAVNFYAAAAGIVYLAKYTSDGTTWTRTWVSAAIAISAAGLQDLTPAQFNGGVALPVAAGEYVAIEGAGVLSYTITNADGAGWYQLTGSVPATNAAVALVTSPRIEVQFVLTYNVQVVTAAALVALQSTTSALQTAQANLSTTASSNAVAVALLTTAVPQTIGRPTSATLVTGTAASTGVYTAATPVANAGLLASIDLFAMATGTITIYRFTLSGSTFVEVASQTATVSATGVVNVPLNMAVNVGDYIGVAGSGIIAFLQGSQDLQWYFLNAAGGSTSAIQSNYLFQVRLNLTTPVQTVTAAALATVQALAAAASTAASASSAAVGLLIAAVPQTIGRPTSATLVTGSAISTSVYTPPTAVANAGLLASIDLFALLTGTITIYRFTLSGSTFVEVASQTATVSATGVVNVPLNMAVNAGDYIGVAGSGIIAYSSGTVDGTYYFLHATGGATSAATPGYYLQMRYNLTAQVQTVTAGALSALQAAVASGGSNTTLSLANVDRIAMVSNSYNEAAATIVGKSAIHNVSALSEYNFANYSKGGQTMAQLAALITAGTGLYGATFAQHQARYAIICENQNSKITAGETDAQYYADTQALIDTVRSYGTTPIIMSEWGSGTTFPAVVDGEQRNLRGMRAIADFNGLMMIDGTSKSRTHNHLLFNQFYKSQHPGVRVSYIISDAILAGLKQLHRPLRSMKIFRVRGTVSVASVASLAYRSLQDRTRLFREIYIGQLALSPGYQINYDVATGLYDSNQTQNSEYYALRTGGALSLGTYALIDCVLPVKAATGVTVALSDTTITVYARQMTNTGISWVQLALANGVYVVPDGSELVSDDRLTLLLYAAAGITLTGSPSVSWTGGTPRVITTPVVPGPPKGTEMMAQPWTVSAAAIPSQWTNSGGLTVDTLVDGAAYLPVGASGAVTVTTTAGLSQVVGAFTSSDDPQEIVIRVWARYCPALFTPIQTTASAATGASSTLSVASASGMSTGMVIAGPGIPASPATTITGISGATLTLSANATVASGAAVYAATASAAPITTETCDTGTLQVTLSGASGIGNASAVLKDQVGLNWREVEFRSTIEAYDTAITIDVRSGDLPIEIAKVSVRSP